jgi:hypothetical protein
MLGNFSTSRKLANLPELLGFVFGGEMLHVGSVGLFASPATAPAADDLPSLSQDGLLRLADRMTRTRSAKRK